MEIFKLINGETDEAVQFVNTAQIDRGEFVTELFCGDKIVAVQPADLADAAAETARSEFVAAALIIIARYDRNSGADKYPRTGSQAEADRENAAAFTTALGHMIENGTADFWISNRTGYPDRAEQVLRNQFSHDPLFFAPKFVKQ